MSGEDIVCDKCGKLTKRDNAYCIHCGAYLGTHEKTPSEAPKPSFVSAKPPKTKKKLNIGYKILIFFSVVIAVNFLVSYFVMLGFQLPPSGYFPVFGGMLILVLIIGGVIWGAASSGSIDVGDMEGCGYAIGIIIAIVIGVPIYIFTVLGSIVQAIAQSIGNAINDAINSMFSQLFSGIEIPGFEPLLFFGLFMLLSFLIVYSYHLKVKKIKKS
ncbi:MAG: hypothetical protein ACFFBH_14950 [Promethearchaeota archaeon]